MNVIRQRSNNKITTAGSSSLATWVVASFPSVFMCQKPRGRWHNCLQAECTSPNQPCRRIKRNWKHGPQQEKLTTGFIIPWSTDGLAFLLNAMYEHIYYQGGNYQIWSGGPESPQPMTRHNSIAFQNRISDCRAHETASFSHHYQHFLSFGID